jgi:predicted enzyme related to lactoylglutathione lyase
MGAGRARRCLTRAMLAAGLVVGCMTSGMTAQLQLPALVEPANQDHHVGKVIFLDLVTPDIAAAKQFYAGLFGWQFRDSQDGVIKYAAASLDGRPVAGLLQREIPAGEHPQPAWLSFLSVRDVDAVAASASQHGAKLMFGPRDFPDRGREAVLADPQGAVFAILASGSGDPPDVLAVPGQWIWSSLITSDPDAGAAFYQALFGYEVYELPAAEGAEHLLLASDDYARASVNSLPAATPGRHPYWLNFVRVEDTLKMTAKVVALGGRVLVEPRFDRHGGRVAVVADPQGAPFGLLEWPSTESKEVPR